MIEKYSIDNHKLMYHPKRISDWLDGKQIYPIYAEISLTSRCNNRCLFCSYNFFLEYKSNDVDTKVIKDTITNMAKCGVKSIMFGGEGESTLHKDFINIIKHTKNSGIDVGLTTNGILLNNIVLKEILPYLSWIKFSIDAGNSEVYSYIHGTSKNNYKKVLDNLSRAVFLNKLKKLNCTIGAQSLLFKENVDGLEELIRFLIIAKPDYFIIKPYSIHNKQNIKVLNQPTDIQISNLKDKLEKYKNKLNIIFRERAFENLRINKPYNECYAKDFMAYIDTLGNVYSCTNFLGLEEYSYGNIYKSKFEDIWNDSKNKGINIDKCRMACRLDIINRYLWRLKNPENHDNFI